MNTQIIPQPTMNSKSNNGVNPYSTPTTDVTDAQTDVQSDVSSFIKACGVGPLAGQDGDPNVCYSPLSYVEAIVARYASNQQLCDSDDPEAEREAIVSAKSCLRGLRTAIAQVAKARGEQP